MHRAHVRGRCRLHVAVQERHRGHECEQLVRHSHEMRLDGGAFGRQLGIGSQDLKAALGLASDDAGYGERAEIVGPVGCPVLESNITWCVEQDVDNRALRRREQHLIDETLALVAMILPASTSCIMASAVKDLLVEPRTSGVCGVMRSPAGLATPNPWR